jgi:anti-sigma B factor antagonist
MNTFGSEEGSALALSLEIDERDGLLVATVHGVLDFFSTGAFQEQLNAALDHGPAKLVLDLEAVTFVDSSGLASLVSIQRRVQAAGGWLRLASPQPQLRRVLHTTNLTGHLNVYASVDQATSAPPPRA